MGLGDTESKFLIEISGTLESSFDVLLRITFFSAEMAFFSVDFLSLFLRGDWEGVVSKQGLGIIGLWAFSDIASERDLASIGKLSLRFSSASVNAGSMS